MNELTRDELVSIITDAGFIAFEYNISDRTVRAVGAFEEVCGYSEKEFYESNVHWWTDQMHPDDRAVIQAGQLKILSKGGAYHGDYRFKTKKGKYVMLRESGFASGKTKTNKLSTKMAALICRLTPPDDPWNAKDKKV